MKHRQTRHGLNLAIDQELFKNRVNLYFIAWAGPGPQPTNNNIIIYNNSTIMINNKY